MNVFLTWSTPATEGVCVSCPDGFPRPSFLILPAGVRPLYLPFESILVGWLPSYPSICWPRQPLPRAIFEGTTIAAAIEQAVSPLAWLPHFPDRLPGRYMPTALQQSYSLSPIGELLAIAERGAWRAQYPPVLFRRPLRPMAGATYTIPPAVAAAGERCVDLVDSGYATPSLADEIVERPAMLDEAVGSSTFIDEEVC